MERGKPTKEHIDLINRLFEGKDVFYTEEELEEKGETTWV